jgi:glycogen debranching enzyme
MSPGSRPRRSDEHVEDVLVNVWYALALRALARLSGDDSYNVRAQRTERALVTQSWDEERGLFWDLAGRDHTPLRVSTWSSLAPLALPSLPKPIARRLIEEHLLDPRRYRSPFGIPSVSMDEPDFRAGCHLFRCWRGPAWINTAWLLVPALRRHGYAAEADRILASCVTLVERHGFREYYNPVSGEGLAARRFGWSTLIVDLLPSVADQRRPGPSSPFHGSRRGELVSMGAEAAAETHRRLRARASGVRKRR